jgi:hypothetical protein
MGNRLRSFAIRTKDDSRETQTVARPASRFRAAGVCFAMRQEISQKLNSAGVNHTVEIENTDAGQRAQFPPKPHGSMPVSQR